MECIECGQAPLGKAFGWRAYRADLEPEDEPSIVFYCADCAAREFESPIVELEFWERRES
jgi:hypothetical protein